MQWYVVDLDNTLVLLEELLLLGKAVFLDPFNVKPQSPCKAHIMNRRYDFMEVNTYMIMCYRLTSICIFMSQHCQLLQYKTQLTSGMIRRECVVEFSHLCAHTYRPLRDEQ